jgi:multidrug efflux pump subunit AcrA (membrane-fusion protein)
MRRINRKVFEKAKNVFKRKKVWIPTAACACAVTVCVVYSNVRSVRGSDTGTTVQSSKAVIGTLTNSIEATGTLESGEGSSIKVPSGLTYEEVCVAAGDSVNAGDVLAKVNHASVLAKMEEIQNEISTIDTQMEAAADDDSSETVTAGVGGTVTAINVSDGDDVASVMADKGAIIEIAVGGDTSQIVGVTATGGTVESISVSAGDTVDSGDTLCTLTTDDYSLEYQQLAAQRSTLVSELQTLIQIAQTDTITASESGTIASVGITAEDDSSSSGTTGSATTASSSGSTSTAVNASYSSTSGTSAVLADCVTYTSLSDADSTESVTTASESTAEQEISLNLTEDETGLNLTAPETGATPQTEITSSDGSWSGTVSWNPTASVFASGTVYTATVTLTAADGYCFTAGTITGSDYSYQIVSQSGDELVLTITFPATSSATESSSSSGSTASSSSASSSGGTASSGSTSGTSTYSGSGSSNSGSGASTGGTSTGSGSAISAASSGSGSSGSTSSSGSGTAAAETVSTTSDTSSDETDSDSSTDTESDLVKAFTMMSADTMSLEVSVDELDINSVEEDQTAEVTLDAIEDETFEGTVTDVGETASSSGNGSAKYTVTISVPKDDDMKVGMSASATIAVEESDENSILIPVNAIQEEGDSTYVYTSVDDDGNLSGKTEVETGISGGDQVVITDGLSEGDTVYYEKTGNVSGGSSDTSGGQNQQGGGMPDMSGGNGKSGSGAPSGNMPSGGPGGNAGSGN